MKHLAIACGVYLILDFASTLAFVPPFYTTSKGLFYTFFQVFVVGVSAYTLVPSAGVVEVSPGQAEGLLTSPGARQ